MPVINPNTPVMNVPVPVIAPANTNKPKPKQPKIPAQPQAPQDSTQDVPPLAPPEPPLNSVIMPWVPMTGKVKASRKLPNRVVKYSMGGAGEGDVNNLLTQLASPEHNHTRWGTEHGDRNFRLATSDALRDVGREGEADLLKNPKQHVIVHQNQIHPGRFTNHHIINLGNELLNRIGFDSDASDINQLATEIHPSEFGRFTADWLGEAINQANGWYGHFDHDEDQDYPPAEDYSSDLDELINAPFEEIDQ